VKHSTEIENSRRSHVETTRGKAGTRSAKGKHEAGLGR